MKRSTLKSSCVGCSPSRCGRSDKSCYLVVLVLSCVVWADQKPVEGILWHFSLPNPFLLNIICLNQNTWIFIFTLACFSPDLAHYLVYNIYIRAANRVCDFRERKKELMDRLGHLEHGCFQPILVQLVLNDCKIRMLKSYQKVSL